VFLTASISSEVCLVLRGCNWIYPVNISTARKIAEWPFSVCVKEGIKSTDQDVLGPEIDSKFSKLCLEQDLRIESNYSIFMFWWNFIIIFKKNFLNTVTE
jgi:hypothetical protein